jgi:hypothetical protein
MLLPNHASNYKYEICEIWGYRDSSFEEYYLLVYEAVWPGRNYPVSQKHSGYISRADERFLPRLHFE